MVWPEFDLFPDYFIILEKKIFTTAVKYYSCILVLQQYVHPELHIYTTMLKLVSRLTKARSAVPLLSAR